VVSIESSGSIEFIGKPFLLLVVWGEEGNPTPDKNKTI